MFHGSDKYSFLSLILSFEYPKKEKKDLSLGDNIVGVGFLIPETPHM